jgi:hypothetical protein
MYCYAWGLRKSTVSGVLMAAMFATVTDGDLKEYGFWAMTSRERLIIYKARVF